MLLKRSACRGRGWALICGAPRHGTQFTRRLCLKKYCTNVRACGSPSPAPSPRRHSGVTSSLRHVREHAGRRVLATAAEPQARLLDILRRGGVANIGRALRAPQLLLLARPSHRPCQQRARAPALRMLRRDLAAPSFAQLLRRRPRGGSEGWRRRRAGGAGGLAAPCFLIGIPPPAAQLGGS